MKKQNVSSDELMSAALASDGDKHLLDYVFFQADAALGHEQAQGLARIAISLLVLLVLLVSKLFFVSVTMVEWNYILLVSAFLLLSLAYYFVISSYKNQFLWRRYFAITSDLGMASYGLYVLGITGLALYPMFLWVVIGNGLRFGTKYLRIATMVGLSGYLTACWASEILYTHTFIVLSLLVGIILIPKFFLVMLHRLAEINQALQEKNRENEHAATHDTLTGLSNRNMFHQRLDQAIAKADRQKSNVAIIFIDLDAFKSINDNFGHDSGDELLINIARCLTRSLRSSDLVARLGGDEFMVLLEDCGGPIEINAVVEQISICAGRYYEFDQYQTYVTWSCGVAIFPQDGTDTTTLIKHADTAMYQAKSTGPNQFMFYSSGMTQEVKRQLILRDELRHSIDDQDFVVYYQPLVEAKTGRILGAEALVRWLHPERGMLMPGDFVDLAEQTGLIVPIGDQVLDLALNNLALLHREGFHGLRIHVNVSPRQLIQDDFLTKLQKVLDDTGLSPGTLDIEVTENVLIEDARKAESLFLELKQMGIGISLDDFGTGFSSLAYLKRFPVDHIKIDRSFIRDIPGDSDDCALVEAMLDIGRRLNRQIIAEGVENLEQETWLLERGCKIMQGYFFSKPVAADEFMSILKAGPLPCVDTSGITRRESVPSS